MTATVARTSQKKIMSNKRQLYSCITLFCIHLPSCVQPRQDTTKFLHGSFSFFLNVDAALKIRILANSLTITRTGLINGDIKSLKVSEFPIQP